MNDLQKRFLLFLIGCIGSRFLLVLITKYSPIQYLPILGYIALVPALGFIYIYLTDSRKTGVEVFSAKIWWNNLRPIHGLLYGLFAYNAINKNHNSWIYLLVDLIFGLFSFTLHHYSEGNFSKIFN
jgi:hypothetical protein